MIAQCFKTLLDNTALTPEKAYTIMNRAVRIASKLDERYYGGAGRRHFDFVGSYGRCTANGNVSDIDMAYFLPEEQFSRYTEYRCNGQSQLLQEVKECILETYPNTEMRGDGQVVVVSFADGMKFEVVPAFWCEKAQYLYANTHNGGSWELSSPTPDFIEFDRADKCSDGKLRNLCRLARVWRAQQHVSIKGILLDTLVWMYLKQNNWGRGLSYAEMSLGFFVFLSRRLNTPVDLKTPGGAETVTDEGGYASISLISAKAAIQAMVLADAQDFYNSSLIWQKIYGPEFPLCES